MCGIVGYVGRRDACPILIKGLHRLEYRGYDSAGVALINPDGRLNVFKCKGKVSDLEHFLDGKDLGGNIGIAHTRWATHGVPNDANAHPHYSESENIALIHNGIIENYRVLKDALEQNGYTFRSSTDSEVLVNLIEYVRATSGCSLPEAVRQALRQVIGAYAIAVVEKGKSAYVGPEIMGKKLGVIGLGAIGILVANAAAELGMDVYGADPYLSVENALKLSGKVHYVKSNKEIFEKCDYITLHVPALPDTKGMINAEAIASMKKTVRLLNFARDTLVDEKAIIDALANGGMACYVTDFATDGLIGLDGVVAMPHLGASTPESEDNCAVMAVREIVDYIENGNIRNSVNLPNVEMAISGNAKICVIHKNAEGLLNNITAPVSAAGLNIENMVSKSKKDYAYTCLDVKGDASGIEAAIKAVSGVVSVRVIK